MEQTQPDLAARLGVDRGETRFPEVLCAVDGTPDSFAAVEQAAALAGADGHLTLLSVTSFEADGSYRGPAIGPLRVQAMLGRATAIAEAAGVSSTIEVDPASPPSHVVLEWAADRDLLAMGAPSTGWFGGLFAGGVAVAAEASFTTPLLIAREAGSSSSTGGPVLVATDGHEGSEQLVLLAARIARDRGERAILVHARVLESNHRRDEVEHQAALLREFSGDACEVLIEHGNARAVIVEAATASGASMIVMSSRRLKGPRALGSVSRRVVHQGHCSVLLVPQELLAAPATA